LDQKHRQEIMNHKSGCEKEYHANTLAVHVSNKCQNQCLFCMERAPSGKRNTFYDESVNAFERLIVSAKKRIPCLERIYIAGGEPTLNKDICTMISLVKSNGLRCDMVSNGGRFVHESFVVKAVKAGLDSVHLSVHSAQKDIHDSLTKRPGSFDRAIKCGEKILKAGIRLYLNIVVNSLNIDSLLQSSQEYLSLFPEHYMQSYYMMRPVGAADLAMSTSPERAGQEIEKAADMIRTLADSRISSEPGVRHEIPGLPLITARDIPPCLLGKQAALARIQDFYFSTGPGEFKKIGRSRYKKKLACIFCRHGKNCPGFLKKYIDHIKG
jgi:MoaA/NifB/PqqE/SkfB family radical SAM enzyme